MYYSLYNSRSMVYLEHPIVGLWHTQDQAEAEGMLKSCIDYLESMGWKTIIPYITIKSFEKIEDTI